MGSASRTMRKLFLSVLGMPLLAYGAYALWDVHRLRAFCNDVGPGTPVRGLR